MAAAEDVKSHIAVNEPQSDPQWEGKDLAVA